MLQALSTFIKNYYLLKDHVHVCLCAVAFEHMRLFACIFAHKHILHTISRCICELSPPAWINKEVEEEVVVVVVEAAKHG